MLHGKAARYLRSLGHELSPTVQIGKEGVTEGVVLATSRALLDHELIKVKVGSEAPDDRSDALASLATATTAELVQVLGRTGLLYKRHPEKPRIKLPAASRPAKLSVWISQGRVGGANVDRPRVKTRGKNRSFKPKPWLRRAPSLP
jgi:RNA-binding protein